ncbi:hypothetical protein AA106555_1547 [Neokomagataea thailandica NBRC 106555]|uniref:Uncharacterized protein n=1 Tax=Neokomagataea thailandica NBRC 106555 TaxID=1223520 RepID=A0ABQ0QRB7_9PROT|nr:hypothetical protein AA106555_1547 [Neokomagataea thailandica NBRC 106555]
MYIPNAPAPIQNGTGMSVCQERTSPPSDRKTAKTTEAKSPHKGERFSLNAVAAGPTIKLNDNRAPAISEHTAHAIAAIPIKLSDSILTGTPLAKAISGFKLANRSGRPISNNKHKQKQVKIVSVLSAPMLSPSTSPNKRVVTKLEAPFER